jgi:hypothetical protein
MRSRTEEKSLGKCGIALMPINPLGALDHQSACVATIGLVGCSP